MIGAAPAVLVVAADSPIKDVAGLIAAAKAKPGELTFGHGGVGTTSEHLAAEMFRGRAGVEMTTVAYKGGPAAMNDVIGGRITAVFTNPVNVVPMVGSGRIRALAVTADKRLSALLRMSDDGRGGDLRLRRGGLVGADGAGEDAGRVVQTLNKAVEAALERGTIRTRLEALNATPMSGVARGVPEVFRWRGCQVGRRSHARPA